MSEPGFSPASLPKVAVLMATYKGEAHISSQIASILWQLRVCVDIYIRDDGSHDRTIQEASDAFPGARVYFVEGYQTLPYATSRGAALNFYRLIASREILPRSYDWIAFSDQDDIWLPSKLDSAIKDCLQTSSVAWSSSIIAFWGATGRTQLIPKHGTVSAINHLFESPGPGCTIVLRSDMFESLQDFIRDNLSLVCRIEFHDWLIYAYILHESGKWFISPTPSMLYRQHSNNVAGAGMSFSQFRKKLKLVASGWYRDHVLTLSSLFPSEGFPVILRLQRLNLWDRICLPYYVWPHRRRVKDRLLLSLVLPFSLIRRSSKRAF